MHQQFLTIKNFSFCHTEFMYFVFVSEQIAIFFPKQNKPIGFYNRDENCFLRGMNWVFK